MFYLQYFYNFHKRENFAVINGKINSKIITYTDKCSFIIDFYDIYYMRFLLFFSFDSVT